MTTKSSELEPGLLCLLLVVNLYEQETQSSTSTKRLFLFRHVKK